MDGDRAGFFIFFFQLWSRSSDIFSPSSPLTSQCSHRYRQNQITRTAINFSALRATRISFIRRSGGGTRKLTGVPPMCFGSLSRWFAFNISISFVMERRISHFIFRGLHLTYVQLVNSFFKLYMGVDAHVNERNDNCVGFIKISLLRDLAFTLFFACLTNGVQWLDNLRIWTIVSLLITNIFRHRSVMIVSFTSLSFTCSEYPHACPFSRVAYHHGTMLISSRLDHGVLRPEEVLLGLIRSSDPFFPCQPPLLILWVNLCAQHLRLFFINDLKRRLPRNSKNLSSGDRIYQHLCICIW